MLWTSALAIYLLFWFLCLFLVLPFHGRRAGGSATDGHDPGAPAQFAVARACLQVTLLSAALFAIYYAIYVSGYFTRASLNFLSAS